MSEVTSEEKKAASVHAETVPGLARPATGHPEGLQLDALVARVGGAAARQGGDTGGGGGRRKGLKRRSCQRTSGSGRPKVCCQWA